MAKVASRGMHFEIMNTHQRKELNKIFTFSTSVGLHSYHPAHSCKDIRDIGYFKKDGEYWIDPEKNGNTLKVFCDMTTDGGKLIISNNDDDDDDNDDDDDDDDDDDGLFKEAGIGAYKKSKNGPTFPSKPKPGIKIAQYQKPAENHDPKR